MNFLNLKMDRNSDLLTIPGVGKSIAADLMNIGIFSVGDLNDLLKWWNWKDKK